MSDRGVVHIIDDDPVICDSLELLLTAEGFDPRAYASASNFLEQVGTLDDGCIITDLRMPEMSGIELLEKLQQLQVKLPVVVMTGDGDVALAIQAMKAGAIDFIEKPFEVEDLFASLRLALADKAEEKAHEDSKAAFVARVTSLNLGEKQVFELLTAGRTIRNIARRLGASQKTVDIHRSNVMTKMHARNLSELLRMAITAGGDAVAEAKQTGSEAAPGRVDPPGDS